MIKDNPFRVLGVVANTSSKEIQKNLSKLNAHLSIGKELKLSFDHDFFGQLTRDEKLLKKSYNLLNLDNNKLENALFWIVNANEIDGVAIEHIIKGNIEKASEIWGKQVQKSSVNTKNFSFYNNLSTLLFAKGEYSKAIKLKAELLESKHIKDFAALVCGDKYKVEKNALLNSFTGNTTSALKETGMKEPEIIHAYSESSQNINEIVATLFVKDPISNIESAIKNAKQLIENIPITSKIPETPISSEDFDKYSKTINDSSDSEKIEINELRALHKTNPLAARKELQPSIGRILVSPIPNYQVNEDTGEVYIDRILIGSGTVIKNTHLDIIICSGLKVISLNRNNFITKTAGDIGSELMMSTNKDIRKLKKVLGNEHFNYQLFADKLASQLEQCGVAYYNQIGNDLDYVDIYKYALGLAEGDRIKNKLIEALKHTSNQKNAEDKGFIINAFELYDEKLQNWTTGFGFVEDLIKKKKEKRNIPSTLESLGLNGSRYRRDRAALRLLENTPTIDASLGRETKGMLSKAIKLSATCKPKLKDIKSNRSGDDQIYLDISSGLVNRLLCMIIAIENEDQKTIDYNVKHANHRYYQINGGYREEAINAIDTNRYNLEKSCNFLDVIGLMDMNDNSKEFFDTNAKIIHDIYNSSIQSYRERISSTPATISEPSSEGCYIATMAYGDYEHPQVIELRKFRDQILTKSFLGRVFIKVYYKTSPFMVKKLKDKKRINIKIMKLLDKFIYKITEE